MKKFLMVIFCLTMALTLVACGGAKEKEYKFGMGVVTSLESSKTGTAQVDATVAAVVTDAEGKIVACRIDVAQNKTAIAEGVAAVVTEFKTKMEKGDAYGMAGKVDNDGNGVMKEWYDQVYAFEAFVIGKTGAEVAALETQFVNNHYIAVDQELLDAGCSMQITDFMEAVAKACADEQGFTFKTAKEFTVGVAADSYDNGSKNATAEADGVVQMYSDFAAAVISEGKILVAINDAIQPQVAFNAAGEITAKTYKGTKRELKSGYGMEGKVDNNGDGVMKEWFEQSKAFSEFVVGMTGAEVAALETELVNGHYISTNEDLLAAGCTIQITAIKVVVAEAAANAR